jgi:F-type H+-transporting ATPase subunit delta
MNSSKASIRYAQALLDLAVENNNLDAVTRDMAYLKTVNDENRDFQVFLGSPVIKSDKKVAVLNEIFGDFDKISQSFITLIAKNGREAILPAIAESFKELLNDRNGIVPVTLTSAAKLDETVKKQIIDKLQASIKGTLEITEVINPSLIGGFVVRMGDIQIDASVASKLAQLKQRLTK